MSIFDWPIWRLTGTSWSESFCLSLGHSLWMITLMTFVVGVLERGLGWLSDDRWLSLRYWIQVVGLFACLSVIPTLIIYGQVSLDRELVETPRIPPRFVPAPANVESDSNGPIDWASQPNKLSPLAAAGEPVHVERGDVNARSRDAHSSQRGIDVAFLVVGAYCGGVVLMLLRLGYAVGCANQIGRLSRPVSRGIWAQRMDALANRWKLKVKPRLRECEAIVTPIVVGVWRPIIVVPVAKTTGLTLEQVELILAHELTHIRRWDSWINGFQRLSEAVLFYHPLIWRLNRRISLLREFICDEHACSHGARRPERVDGDPGLDYAQALLHLLDGQHRQRVKHSLLSLSATGQPHSEIKQRIARVLGQRLQTSNRSVWGGSAMATMTMLLVLLASIAWLAPSEALSEQASDLRERRATR